MDCRECDGLLVAYVKGDLSKEDAALVERHIASCYTCRWNEQAARRSLELIREADDEAIERVVRAIFQRAAEEGASDIHIEPELVPVAEGTAWGDPYLDAASDKSVRVRLRIDGVLHDVMRLPRHVGPPLATRVEIMADLDPFERRIPQFGRIAIGLEGKELDMRVSTLPVTQGTRLVLRVMQPGGHFLHLDALGLSHVNRERIEEACSRPHGVFLACGPAGGGRSTLLYAMLSHLKRDETSIVTVENPVEVFIPGVAQMHVNRKVGLDYAFALRAIMRQDPDIVMCAAVPDREVAEVLNQVALTGHLALTSVTGNDAPHGLNAYAGLAGDPILTGRALIGAVGTRLVRTVCGECAEEVSPSAADIEFLKRGGVERVPEKLRRGTGCDRCRRTGYLGRTGIHEVLLIDDDLREKIQLGEAGLDDLRASIKPSMVADAAAKAAEGITTVEEAVRVTAAVGQS